MSREHKEIECRSTRQHYDERSGSDDDQPARDALLGRRRGNFAFSGFGFGFDGHEKPRIPGRFRQHSQLSAR
jgi:hypothetical protein